MGEMSFYGHAGYTFSIYSSNDPVEICLKYALGLLKWEENNTKLPPPPPTVLIMTSKPKVMD